MPDSNRPLYHFLPEKNWLNDPNGLIHWQGRYHMFYQYNPEAAVWGRIHWGHADSSDLVHWRHRPVAFAPQAGGPDQDGVWSGCAVEVDGKVAFLYTGVTSGPEGFVQRPCLGWGEGDLERITRHPANPVIPEPPAGLRLAGFRDHTVWREGGAWRMAIGSGVFDQGPLALLYRSADLVEWQYLGPLCSSADVISATVGLGEMWECPAFIQVDGQTALLVSSCYADSYGPTILTGSYQDGRLRNLTARELDYGGITFYAPQSVYDASGRCLMFGWLREARPVDAQVEAGWSGAMSLPRQIRFDARGEACYAFAPELEALRRESYQRWDFSAPEGLTPLPRQGRQVEILLELERGEAARCGLALLRSPGGEEETRLVVDWEQGRLTLDRSRSSLDESVERGSFSAPLPLEDGRARIHLYLDGSVIECIAGGKIALSARVYPTLAGSEGLALFAEGGSGMICRLDLYTLASAW